MRRPLRCSRRARCASPDVQVHATARATRDDLPPGHQASIRTTLQPEEAVAVLDVGARHAALVNGELVTERDAFQDELRSILRGELEQPDQEGDVGHPPII